MFFDLMEQLKENYNLYLLIQNRIEEEVQAIFGTKFLKSSVPTRWPQLSWISTNLVSMDWK